MARFGNVGKLNVKALAVLLVLVVLGGGGLAGAYKIRKAVIRRQALKAGDVAYAQGQWDEAHRQYARYLSRGPDDLAVLHRYAQSCLWWRPLDASRVVYALDAYRRIMRRDPGNAEAYTRVADLCISRGDFDGLRHVAGVLQEAAPGAPEAVFWQAQALVQQQVPASDRQAEKLLTALVGRLETAGQKSRYHAKACGVLTLLAIRQGQGDLASQARQARQWADQAVAQDPNSAAALIARAHFTYSYRQRLGLSDAQAGAAVGEDLDRATALSPGDPSDWLAISELWMLIGRLEPAQSALAQAAQADAGTLWRYGSDVDAWQSDLFVQTARLGLMTGQPGQALALAEEALEQIKRIRYRVRVLEYAIQLYAFAEQPAAARRCLEAYVAALSQAESAKSLLADPRLALLRVIVLRAEYRPDKWQEIIKLLHPLLATESAPAELHGMLGEAYSQTHQGRLAIRELTTYVSLLEVRGQAPEAAQLRRLVREHRWRGDLASALYYARLLEQTWPGEPAARLERIEIETLATDARQDARGAERLARLRQELEEVRQTTGDRIELTILEALVWASAGQADKAEALLRRAARGADGVQARVQLAALLARGGPLRRAEAVEQCRRLTQDHPGLPAGWLTLSRLLEDGKDLDGARAALEQGLPAVEASGDRRGLEVQLAMLDLRHGRASEGLERLNRLAGEDLTNVRLRTLLLEIPEVRQDRARFQRLIEELRAIQGEPGVQWRYYQARLWLDEPDWRDRRESIATLLMACRSIDPDWVAPAMLLGELEEREGNLDGATVIYQTALKDSPGSIELVDRLIRLLERQKRFREAVEVLDRLEGADPRRVGDLRIRLALSGADAELAVQELRRRVAEGPRDAASRVLLAQLLFAHQHDAAAALELLEQAQAIEPDSLVPATAQIAILRGAGRGEEVLPMLDREVSRRGSFEAHLLRGRYLALLGRLEQADADYRKLPDLSATGDGHVMLAEHYLRTARVDQAREVLADGLARHPRQRGVKEQYVRVLLSSPAAAARRQGMTMLEDLLAERPDDPRLRVIQARALLQRGDGASVRKAESALREVAHRYPLMLEAHQGLAQSAAARGDFAAMRQVVREARRTNGDSVWLLILSAQAEDRLGNLDLARQTTAQALRLAPLSGAAHAFAVDLAVRHGDRRQLVEQLRLIQSALAVSAEDEELHLAGAQALEALDRPAEAVGALEGFVRTSAGRRSLAARLALCRLHRQAGALAAAWQQLQQAQALAGNDARVLVERILLLGAADRHDEVLALADNLGTDDTPDERVVEAVALVLRASPRTEHRQSVLAWYARLARDAAPLSLRYKLAHLMYTDGDPRGGLALYEDLCRQMPEHPNVLNDLAWILANEKGPEQIARAIELSGKAVVLNPGDANLHHTRAFALAASPRRQDWSDARQAYQRFLEMTREQPARQARGLAELGLLLARMEQKDDARAALTEALRLDAQSPTLPDATRQQAQSALETLDKI